MPFFKKYLRALGLALGHGLGNHLLILNQIILVIIYKNIITLDDPRRAMHRMIATYLTCSVLQMRGIRILRYTPLPALQLQMMPRCDQF